MFIVLDENENLIEAKDAIKGNHYYCSVCHKGVRFIAGKIYAKHFAYMNKECLDNCVYKDMSEWHRAR